MQEPLQVHSANEVRYYLLATPCEVCGAGPCVMHAATPPADDSDAEHARATCQACQAGRVLPFVSEYQPADPDTPCISPTDEPSTVVDLDQWLGLFYQLSDFAARQSDPHEARLLTMRSTMCLAEALKFYEDDDDEMPPASAFFNDTSRLAFHEHPQNFTRQLLRDLQAKLPPAPAWPE